MDVKQLRFDAKRLRVDAGMTQQQLADEIGVSRQTVCDNETNKTKSKKMDILLIEYWGDKLQIESEESKLTDADLRRVYADIKAAMSFLKDTIEKVQVCL
jgi:DNA-binding XRE family transcriptional regulator